MPSRLPTAWFILAPIALVLPTLLISVLGGLSGLIMAGIMPGIGAAAACIAMGSTYRHFLGAGSDVRTAGWIHWTLWLMSTLCGAAFWVLQARMMTGGTLAQSSVALGIVSAVNGLLHLAGWIVFIALVSSIRLSIPPIQKTFG